MYMVKYANSSKWYIKFFSEQTPILLPEVVIISKFLILPECLMHLQRIYTYTNALHLYEIIISSPLTIHPLDETM